MRLTRIPSRVIYFIRRFQLRFHKLIVAVWKPKTCSDYTGWPMKFGRTVSMRVTIALMILLTVGLLLACSARPGQLQANTQLPQASANDSSSIVPEGDKAKTSGAL